MTHRDPMPVSTAFSAVIRCAVTSASMLAHGRVHLPRRNIGRRLVFGDGTTGRVYRETIVDRPPPTEPCVLVVEFRLRGVGGWGHVLFRWESLLNTPLFVGFPGFVSKLWMAHDSNGAYRGLYEWDGPHAAEQYARALWRVLALVSVPGSIDYQVLPGMRRDELLAQPSRIDPAMPVNGREWWRLIEAA